MTEREFEGALDRWGSDLTRWPADQARQAHAHLTASAEAREALERAARVDGYLSGLKRHQPPAHLKRRILAQLPATDSAERLLDWLTARLWRPALLALVPVMAGFLVGLAITEPLDTELSEEVVTLAFSDLYGELNDAQP